MSRNPPFLLLGGVKGLTVSKGDLETVQTSGTSYISYQGKGIIILQSSSNANISIYAVGIQSNESGMQTIFKGSGIFTLESESGGFFKVGLDVTNRRIFIRNSYTGMLAFGYHYISFTV